MNKGVANAVGLALTSLLSITAAAQNASAKAALSPSQAVLTLWNDVGRKLIAMAEDFPEDKYEFKPAPAQRSFADQLLRLQHALSGHELQRRYPRGLLEHAREMKSAQLRQLSQRID